MILDALTRKPKVNWRDNDPEADGVFWRFVSDVYRSDEDAPRPAIYITKWKRLRDTPKGCWIVDEYCDTHGYDTPEADRSWHQKWKIEAIERQKKLVLKGTGKRWAYPTKALAWDSFKRRQHHRMFHCRVALENAELVWEMMKAEERKT